MGQNKLNNFYKISVKYLTFLIIYSYNKSYEYIKTIRISIQQHICLRRTKKVFKTDYNSFLQNKAELRESTDKDRESVQR
jgi:hypothetical protein